MSHNFIADILAVFGRGPEKKTTFPSRHIKGIE